MPASPLDQILAAVRARLEHRAEAARERAAAIRQAADEYAKAVEREALAELAGRMDVGIDVKSGVSALAAAEALRKAATDLPELRTPSKHVTDAPPAPSRTSERGLAPRPGGSRKVGWKEELSARKGSAEHEGTVEGGPLLRASARKTRVVVVGGPPPREKLERLAPKLGFELEWIAAEKASAKAVRALEGRILDGRVAAIVLLDGFIAHSQSEPLVRAARQTATPLAYGDKGGMGALDKALRDVETELARRARPD